jgi:hypothetical protein
MRNRSAVLAVGILLSAAVYHSLPTSAPDAAELHRVFPLVVYDANGEKVGESAIGPQPLVHFKAGGNVFGVIVTPLGFLSSGFFWFADPDTICSGTPLMNPLDPVLQLLPYVAVGPPGSTAYIPDPQAVPQTLAVGSQRFFGPFGGCFPAFGTQSLVPALGLIDLDTRFTPPFSVGR